MKEVIIFSKNDISKNEGIRMVAKLMLNSQWGRYAMNTNKIQVKFVVNPIDFHRFFDDSKFIVHDCIFPNEEIVIVFFSEREVFHQGSHQTNVVLASFVTCYARIKLFECLDRLGDRVIYYDTDSVIYKLEGTALPCGDNLGELKDELEGDCIIEFVSAGAKNYSY